MIHVDTRHMVWKITMWDSMKPMCSPSIKTVNHFYVCICDIQEWVSRILIQPSMLSPRNTRPKEAICPECKAQQVCKYKVISMCCLWNHFIYLWLYTVYVGCHLKKKYRPPLGKEELIGWQIKVEKTLKCFNSCRGIY